MFVFYKFHCSFTVNAFLFFYDEETLQKKEVESLWTVGASNTHITSGGWVIFFVLFGIIKNMSLPEGFQLMVLLINANYHLRISTH